MGHPRDDTPGPSQGIIKKKFGGDATLIGDEGGFAPPCDARQGVELIMEAIEKAGYKERAENNNSEELLCSIGSMMGVVDGLCSFVLYFRIHVLYYLSKSQRLLNIFSFF